MNIFLLGDDPINQRLAKQRFQRNFVEKFPRAEVQYFDFGENDKKVVEKFLVESQSGFFATPSLLVVEAISELPPKEQMLILETIKNLSEEKACIARERKNFPKADPFLKNLVKQGFDIETFSKKSRSRGELIQEVSKELSLPIKTIQAVSERAQEDEEFLTRLLTIDIFSHGESVSPDDLQNLVPMPVEVKIFDALDMLAAGNQNGAVVTFRALLDEDDVFRILSMCAWQLRQMLVVEEYMRNGVTDKNSIAKEAGLHPFVVQKIQRSIPNFPKRRLVKALQLVARIDRGLKKSEYTKVAAIDTFVFGV